jgi:hypothetical protein
MDEAPVFFSVGQDTYRLRFPGLLEGFGEADKSASRGVIEEDAEGRFDSDERDYFIRGYGRGSTKYDIRVSEFGSDLQPARIEAWLTAGGKQADIPPDLRDSIVARNEEASRGRTLLYINDRGI